MSDQLHPFREVWLVDFEFRQPPGERPTTVCLVAREFRTGRTIRAWHDELAAMPEPPFSIGTDALLVAYFASAELGCFKSLGWPPPARILDLFCEFRCLTNGLATIAGNGLIGALAHFGLPSIDAAEKTELRDLAQRPGPHTAAERLALLDYCESDVLALAKLLPAMLPGIDLPRALLRGRYMGAVAAMEWNGVPIDVEAKDLLQANWQAIRGRLVQAVDQDFGVYVPSGQRTINPQSRLGSEIFRVATEYEIDPHELAEAVDYVWTRERESDREHSEAITEARKATGLTVNRIARWEGNAGDASNYPGLDTTARELAGSYPALGIGQGYESGAAYDDTDYAGRLWQLLREPQRPNLPKHDPAILRQAAELVSANRGQCPEPGPMSFSAERFAEWLIDNGIPWPRLQSGALALDDDTFRQMSRAYPTVAPLRELRHSLGEMRLFDLAVGADGRNRALLSPFRSITGRNQPSNVKFIFGPSTWLRGLIRPEAGLAIAYVDWSQQEFGIAAALSGDAAMLQAYTSADPYLTFAKQAGAVPPDATKETHGQQREQFKVCSLAVQYGMGPASLAQSLGTCEAAARELLQLHRRTYPTFWRWSESAVNHAMLLGWLTTVFGWKVQVGSKANPRSLANYPMQGNGAEMLRLACCLATERGIQVCAPVHDAILVEADEREIDATVAATQAAMAEASRVVLDGFELRTDAKIVRHPERYMDKRGEKMWHTVFGLLDQRTRAMPVPLGEPHPCVAGNAPMPSWQRTRAAPCNLILL